MIVRAVAEFTNSGTLWSGPAIDHSAGVSPDIPYLSKFFSGLLYQTIGIFRNSDMLVDITERLSDDACITENMW